MTYTFTHNGKPHPQGRPKITTKPFPKVYYSGPSTAYRKELVKAFTKVKEDHEECIRTYFEDPSSPFPLPCAEVHIYVWGLRRNADSDNMAKQALDALVTAGVIEGDEWPHVPVLVVRCATTESHPEGIVVELVPTEVR